MTRLATAILLLALPACTRVTVGQHVATTSPFASLRTIVLVERVTNANRTVLSGAVAEAIIPALARCGIAATVFRRGSAGVSTAASGPAKPDATLTATLVVSSGGGDPLAGAYMFTLHHVTADRDLWKAIIAVQPSLKRESVAEAGALLARDLVRTMAADNVLGSCHPLPAGDA